MTLRGQREVLIPAGHGIAVEVVAGDAVQVVNTHGTQVIDTWAFTDRPGEYLSMEHSREVIQRVSFEPGDRLITNRYRTALTFVDDTSPGEHDTLIAACSPEMFAHLGAGAGHASCSENLATALAAVGRRLTHVPSPWNLFMSARVDAGGSIRYRRPEARPGDYVELRSDLDLLLVFSACPDDVYPTNGGDGRARDALARVLPRSS